MIFVKLKFMSTIIKTIGLTFFLAGCVAKSKLEKSYFQDPDKFIPEFVKYDLTESVYYKKSNDEKGSFYLFKIKNNGTLYDSIYFKFIGDKNSAIVSFKNDNVLQIPNSNSIYTIVSLSEDILKSVGAKTGLDLTSKWSIMAKGIARQGKIKTSWSETLSGVQFMEPAITINDTLGKHLLTYSYLYTPKIMQDSEEPLLYQTSGRSIAYYPLKISLQRQMPKYEILIGLNDKGLNPIRIVCDGIEDVMDINFSNGYIEFKLALSAVEAHNQCFNNGFISTFKLKDSAGNLAKTGEDGLHAAHWYLKVRGFYNDSIKGPWSYAKKIKFKC